MSGTAFFFVLLGVACATGRVFAFVDWIVGKAR